jgi:hypothetical protein
MSAEITASDSSIPVAGVPAGDGGRTAEVPNAAGRLLGRLSVLPALLAMAWLLTGLPLLMLGWFTWPLMVALSVPVAAVAVIAGLRWIPDRWPGTLPASGAGQASTPWWAVAGVIVVAAAFGAEQLIYHSQQIIIVRDPASYIQFGAWIARHGSLPIPQSRAAFGGPHHLLIFSSPGYFQVGGSIVPQFMAGMPMLLAAAFWAGGVSAAVLVAPVLGAAAVLTFGGLAARLAGPRWAPLAALVLALSMPEQFTSRSTYSEPAAQILFLGGLCLVIDSFGTEGIGTRVITALGGIALGLTLLARIDGASDLLPVIPYCGLLLVGRRKQALPLIGGVIVGALYGVVDGVVLSRPYLTSIKGSLIPLVIVGVALLVITGAATALRWRRGLPEVRRAWLPNAVAALAVVTVIGFAVRPYVQTVHGQRTAADEKVMALFQKADHLPVDPARLYYEISLHWVFWYVGLPAVVLATLAAAVLSRRCLRGRAPAWALPLMAFAWIIVATLLRPAITPDQPWASRRLVPAVLPGFVLLAAWAVSWLVGRLRQRGRRRLAWVGVAALCAAALVLPAARTTFGLAHADRGPVGVTLVADGLATKVTYGGEIAAVSGMCAAIPARASVLIVFGRTEWELSEVVRGMCGVPVAGLIPVAGRSPADGLTADQVATVRRIVRGIRQAGREPVLLAARRAQLRFAGGPRKRIMKLLTAGDEHTLTTPPLGTSPFGVNVWMSVPAR